MVLTGLSEFLFALLLCRISLIFYIAYLWAYLTYINVACIFNVEKLGYITERIVDILHVRDNLSSFLFVERKSCQFWELRMYDGQIWQRQPLDKLYFDFNLDLLIIFLHKPWKHTCTYRKHVCALINHLGFVNPFLMFITPEYVLSDDKKKLRFLLILR